MTHIEAAVARLNQQLPLAARQSQLSAADKKLHQAILFTLARQGRPPSQDEMSDIVGKDHVTPALHTLGQQDLIVLSERGVVLGAYPITLETTAHRITLNGHHLHAMCALDAVAIAPMFNTHISIDSRCHLSDAPIHIQMHNHAVINADPAEPTIGIRWQMPSQCAAHSMCTEMVFFKDETTARQWQGEETDNISLFTLPEAIEFGAAFFLPLLNDES